MAQTRTSGAQQQSQSRKQMILIARYIITLTTWFICGSLGVIIAQPYLTLSSWVKADNKLAYRVEHLKVENQQSELEVQSLKTSLGVEQAARRLGYLPEGERPLRIP